MIPSVLVGNPAELLRLPIQNPVMVFALAMVLFVSVPLLFERFRLPGIIGLIIAGAVVGPNALGLLERDETIILLGTVGLLYLMFMAGVEVDLHGFQRNRGRSLGFGAMTFILPQVAGTGAGLLLGYGWAAAILLGSMLASHTLVAYPIASRLGVAKNEAVTVTVGGTIITDLVALLVLAVVAASIGGDLNGAFWLRLGVSLAVFGALVLFRLPRVGRWFFRNENVGEAGAYIFVLAALYTAAVLAEVAGVEPIIGAFLAGLALNRPIPEGGPLNNRLNFFGNAVFVPFFLLSVGMLVDVRVLLAGTRAWMVMITMTMVVVGTKWLAAKLSQRTFGYAPDEGWMMFGLSVPQAAATLAAALIGYRIELFDTAVLNGAILMILVTCTIGPWVVEHYGRRLALREERKPYSPREAPQRILIPIADATTADRLLDLAFLVRAPDSDEPLRPVTVVRGHGRDAAGGVADAEKMLSHAVAYAAGGNVPVNPLTRVDHNFASGIIRGMAESRATLVVAGRDGLRSRRSGVLSDVLDQVLERTEQLVMVAKLEHPLSITRRVVLLLPPCIDRSRGFCDALHLIKGMTHRLGATLLVLGVTGDTATFRDELEAVRPEIPTAWDAIAGWDGFDSELREHLQEGDLVVLVSARRQTVAWRRELDGLPRKLASLVPPESFIVAFPCEIQSEEDTGAPPPASSRELQPAAA